MPQLYPTKLPDLRTRMQYTALLMFSVVLITYWIGAVPNAWPLFKDNVALYATYTVLAAFALYTAISSVFDPGLALCTYIISILCTCMAPRAILQLALNSYACTGASDEKTAKIQACMDLFQKSNVPVQAVHLACLKEEGIDLGDQDPYGSCPFLSGSAGTFYVAMMYLMSIFVLLVSIYILQIASRLKDLEYKKG